MIMKHFVIIAAIIASLGAASVAQAHTVNIEKPSTTLDSPVFQGD